MESFLLMTGHKNKGFSRWEADWKPDRNLRRCDQPDCAADGAFRAPKSRDRLDDHYWFCLEHVRDYNARWNFFEGMSASDINRFQHDNAFGHRPTWRFAAGSANTGDWGVRRDGPPIEDPFGVFSEMTGAAKPAFRQTRDGALKPLTSEDMKALHALGLNEKASDKEIKAAYKALVKKLHPDKTGGDKRLEARFHDVTSAYQHCAKAGFC